MTDLILVDSNDNVIGYKEKAACHTGDPSDSEGKPSLHRAFSIWIFNDKKQTLIQKRSDKKLLWPGFWSNSCYSHPIKGESLEKTLQRRLKEELGVSCPVDFLYKFKYKAEFGSIGAEHEMCYVYRGIYSGEVKPDPDEVSATRWISLDKLKKEVKSSPEKFTPWMKMELERIDNGS